MKIGTNVVSKCTILQPGLIELYKEFTGDIIRYPGGNTINTYDQVEGRDKVSHQSWHTKFDHKALKGFMDDTGTKKVILGVNPFDSDQEIINTLLNARSEGIPITHLEIGNELYFSKWDMTAEEYIEKVLGIHEFIRMLFPGVKIAGLAIGKNGNTAKQKTWNEKVRVLDPVVDAWTVHVYVTKGWSVDKRLSKMDSALSKLDTAKPLWFTEVGTRNADEQLIELMDALEPRAEIVTPYCLMNFTEEYSMVSKASKSITNRGQLMIDWMSSRTSLIIRFIDSFKRLLRPGR